MLLSELRYLLAIIVIVVIKIEIPKWCVIAKLLLKTDIDTNINSSQTISPDQALRECNHGTQNNGKLHDAVSSGIY